MAKGFSTQSAMVLLEQPVDLDALMACLAPLRQLQRDERSEPGWMSKPSVLVPMRPEVNGHVLVDLVDEPWPDGMGDPKEDVDLFGAWSMGFFGPWVFPGNLSRAQAMSFTWREAREVSSRHRAFVRIRSSYVFGAGEDAPLMPEDYEPLDELEFITEIALHVLKLPGALAYFNPNGEVLRTPQGVSDELAWCEERNLVPLPLWANVRLFQLGDGYCVMDTIGMEQLDTMDHEAVFRPSEYEAGAVDGFLRGISLYVLQNGPVIENGNTADGPGGVRWEAQLMETSVAPQPRPVLRWVPQDGSPVPSFT